MRVFANNTSNLLKLGFILNSLKSVSWGTWCSWSGITTRWSICSCWLGRRGGSCLRFRLIIKFEKWSYLTAAACSSGGIPFVKYSTALSGLLNAALSAASASALGNPIAQSESTWNIRLNNEQSVARRTIVVDFFISYRPVKRVSKKFELFTIGFGTGWAGAGVEGGGVAWLASVDGGPSDAGVVALNKKLKKIKIKKAKIQFWNWLTH